MCPIGFGLVFRGGPIELEQMGSADPPLAVHCLYGGRDRQHRRRGTEEVYRLGGPLGAAPARLAAAHRLVLVRAAVCHQVAQRATRRLNGRPAARRWPGGVGLGGGPSGRASPSHRPGKLLKTLPRRETGYTPSLSVWSNARKPSCLISNS